MNRQQYADFSTLEPQSRQAARDDLRETLDQSMEVVVITLWRAKDGYSRRVKLLAAEISEYSGTPAVRDITNAYAKAYGVRWNREDGGVMTDDSPGELVAHLSIDLYGIAPALSCRDF